VKIRIRELPDDKQHVDDFDLRGFERGHVYEVGMHLAEYLVVMNYAMPEMRRPERDTANDSHRRRRGDRKR
jgi:hypothetical protein